MYLHQLQNWSDNKWAKKLAPYGLSEEECFRVKQILTLPNKSALLSHKDELLQLGIVNGLGPYYFPTILRRILSGIFDFIDWFFHDIKVFISDDKDQLKEADMGIKKYGKISIKMKTIERISSGSSFIVGYNIFLAVPIKLFILYLFYLLLRMFSRFSANR